MIHDEETARATLDLIDKAHALLMSSLNLVRGKCSDEEYEAFEKGMAHALGRLFFLVMDPIYREHPSLAPPQAPKEFLDTWRRSSKEDK